MDTTTVVKDLELTFEDHSERPKMEGEILATIKSPIRIDLWGKDHWSTLSYLETCAVDNKGVPSLDRMRCDIDRHPGLYGSLSMMTPKKYPTLLKYGIKAMNHDDWDCVDDMEAVGLLT